MVGGKEGNVSTTQKKLHEVRRKTKRGREPSSFFRTQNSLSLPDDTVWELAKACIVAASRLPTFFPLVFLVPTAFGPLQTGGSSSPIVQFEKDEEINPSLSSFLPSLPPLVLSLSLPLYPSLHPLPPWQSTPAWSWLQASTQRSALGLPHCISAPALSGFVDLRLQLYKLLYVQVRSAHSKLFFFWVMKSRDFNLESRLTGSTQMKCGYNPSGICGLVVSAVH